MIRNQLPENAKKLTAPELLRAFADKKNQHFRRAVHWQGMVSFEDAWPDDQAELAVDIINPHHKNYYEGKTTPHDAENPIPIFFLTLAPGTAFTFRCRAIPGRNNLWSKIGNWKPLMDAAFDHACDWLGFGAKTSVGYGQFAPMNGREETGEIAPVAVQSNQGPLLEIWEGVQIKWNKGKNTLEAIKDRKTASLEGMEKVKTMIPEQFHGAIWGKKPKALTATLEVNPTNFRIFSIKIES